MPRDTRIIGLDVTDVRFPTSLELAGSDAMNHDPDYSGAYVVVRTDSDLVGHGLTFTIGRGNEVQVAAIRALEPLVVGQAVNDVLADLGGFSRLLVWDSPLRWLGPEKGVMHMGIGAVINAVWDLYARREGKPLWKLLADLNPRQLVDLVDFRYLTDALEPEEALEFLERARPASTTGRGGSSPTDIRRTPHRLAGLVTRMRRSPAWRRKRWRRASTISS